MRFIVRRDRVRLERCVGVFVLGGKNVHVLRFGHGARFVDFRQPDCETTIGTRSYQDRSIDILTPGELRLDAHFLNFADAPGPLLYAQPGGPFGSLRSLLVDVSEGHTDPITLFVEGCERHHARRCASP